MSGPVGDLSRTQESSHGYPQVPSCTWDKLKSSFLNFRAARYGNKKVTRLLLDRGATPSVRNSVGMTPLHLACLFNQLDIAKVSAR